MINLSEKEKHSYIGNMNDMERSTAIVGGNTNFGGASRTEIYNMAIKHDLEIYQNLNKMSQSGGNLLYGFAWTRTRAQDIYYDMH